MSGQKVTIIMRSFNEGWALRETLAALKDQIYNCWELIVVDSGSTDGSQEMIRAAKPRQFIQIAPHEYNPGRVLNNAMRLADSFYGIFLNADATPIGNDWLGPLVNALQNPSVAAVFSRQMPRNNCEAVFACDYERCFGSKRESSRWPHFFSLVSSGIRKDVWSKRGFVEVIQYAEDDEYTRWCMKHGYEVLYCPESSVTHSHNYSAAQAYQRSFGDARALATYWKGRPQKFNFLMTVLAGWLNDARHDLLYCWSASRIRELPHAARIRWAQRRGRLDGFRAGWNEYRRRPA